MRPTVRILLPRRRPSGGYFSFFGPGFGFFFRNITTACTHS
jgi:hypothetical protein